MATVGYSLKGVQISGHRILGLHLTRLKCLQGNPHLGNVSKIQCKAMKIKVSFLVGVRKKTLIIVASHQILGT